MTRPRAALAGRCQCGVTYALAAADPELHLGCVGLKRCCTCRQVKPVDDFYRRQDGEPRFECKACHAVRSNAWARERYRTDPVFRAMKLAEKRLDREVPAIRELRAESYRAYYKRNSAMRNASSRRYHAAHREEQCQKARQRYQRNREARLAAQRAYYVANRGRILAQKRARGRVVRTEAA